MRISMQHRSYARTAAVAASSVAAVALSSRVFKRNLAQAHTVRKTAATKQLPSLSSATAQKHNALMTQKDTDDPVERARKLVDTSWALHVAGESRRALNGLDMALAILTKHGGANYEMANALDVRANVLEGTNESIAAKEARARAHAIRTSKERRLAAHRAKEPNPSQESKGTRCRCNQLYTRKCDCVSPDAAIRTMIRVALMCQLRAQMPIAHGNAHDVVRELLRAMGSIRAAARQHVQPQMYTWLMCKIELSATYVVFFNAGCARA